MPNKTKQKNTLKVLKKYERRKKQFESHTSHDSLSSIPYRSNGWSWNPNWHWKNIQSFRKQLIQCLSLLYLSALRISSSIRRIYACNALPPPLPYPAVPTPNLVVSRTRPLNPVPRPPKKTVTPLSLRIFSTMLFLCANAFSKARTLHSIPWIICKHFFFISHPK